VDVEWDKEHAYLFSTPHTSSQHIRQIMIKFGIEGSKLKDFGAF